MRAAPFSGRIRPPAQSQHVHRYGKGLPFVAGRPSRLVGADFRR